MRVAFKTQQIDNNKWGQKPWTVGLELVERTLDGTRSQGPVFRESQYVLHFAKAHVHLPCSLLCINAEGFYYRALHIFCANRCLTGLVIASLSWKNDEWVGFCVACDIGAVIQSLPPHLMHRHLPSQQPRSPGTAVRDSTVMPGKEALIICDCVCVGVCVCV